MSMFPEVVIGIGMPLEVAPVRGGFCGGVLPLARVALHVAALCLEAHLSCLWEHT